MNRDVVSIKSLAASLGLDRSNTLKYVKQLGFLLVQRRGCDTRGQYAAHLSKADAEAVITLRQNGYPAQKRPGEQADVGELLVIRLEPRGLGRVRLGFASSAGERPQQICANEATCQVVCQWSCRRLWESAAVDALTREDCHLVSEQTFHCSDLAGLITRGNAFFALMPAVERSPAEAIVPHELLGQNGSAIPHAQPGSCWRANGR